MEKPITILAIIPARKGSKGVAGKNMKILGEKPLIQYTIESALQSKLLTRIAVSSDCEDTIEFAQKFEGVEAPFIRPAELSGDCVPSVPVMKHAIEFFRKNSTEFDYVCLLQPTSPFRSAGLIDKTILHLLTHDADSLATVQKIPDKYNPSWAFYESGDQLISPVIEALLPTRRQDLRDAYCRDGKIYLVKTQWLDQDQLLAGKCLGYQTMDEEDLNINTMEDWKHAETYIELCNQPISAHC